MKRLNAQISTNWPIDLLIVFFATVLLLLVPPLVVVVIVDVVVFLFVSGVLVSYKPHYSIKLTPYLTEHTHTHSPAHSLTNDDDFSKSACCLSSLHTHTHQAKFKSHETLLNDMLLLKPNAVAVAAAVASICGLDGTYLSITTQTHTSQLYIRIVIYFLLLFEWPE